MLISQMITIHQAGEYIVACPRGLSPLVRKMSPKRKELEKMNREEDVGDEHIKKRCLLIEYGNGQIETSTTKEEVTNMRKGRNTIKGAKPLTIRKMETKGRDHTMTEEISSGGCPRTATGAQ